MNEERHERIKELIEKNGAMGVNAIARTLDIPLSTIQKYLEKQSYFKKTEDRKWDLPERVQSTPSFGATDDFNNVIDAQLSGIESMINILNSQLRATITLIQSQKNPASPPVASSYDFPIDKRLLKFSEGHSKLQEIIRSKKNTMSEEHYELLINYDHIGLIFKEGYEYADTFISDEISMYVLNPANGLSDDAISILKENQFTK